MKRQNQSEINPFQYSDSNKRYQTYDYYMKKRFGAKCGKVSLDAGFTCPNIDGTLSSGGCIYCSGGSSGSLGIGEPLSVQYAKGTEMIRRKWATDKFVPYLQAHTNTYAPLDVLKRVYSEAAALPGAVMLDIATRADCLSEDVLGLLCEVSKEIPLCVELGLQSVHDKTAGRINRGHDFSAFTDGYDRLRSAGGDIVICVHLINGLPGESTEMMLESAAVLAKMRPDMVKLHLLHIIRGTPLCELYESGGYTPMPEPDYVDTVCSQIELFAPETVIARVSGDAPEGLLVAPEWCRQKTEIANNIDKELFRRKSYQGSKYYYNNLQYCYKK